MTTVERTCSRCGAPVPGQARFCPGCGSTGARPSPGQVLDAKYEILGAHPDDPLVNEIRDSLPAFLRSREAEAFDRAQPLNAVLYFRAYRQLSFAPPDNELQSRIERLR